MKDREITKIPIDQLKFDGQNPNVMTKDEEIALKQSIEKYGNIVPVIVDKDNVVADGEHRVKVLKLMGYYEVPAYRLEEIDETERKILRQVMNKLKGKHDKLLDYEEFKRIVEGNGAFELMQLLPNYRQEIKQIIDKIENPLSNKEDEYNPDDYKPKYKIEKGQIWKLGNHRLMCGDSTNPEDVEKLMAGNKCDLCLTDPPYGVSYSTKNDFLNRADKGMLQIAGLFK